MPVLVYEYNRPYRHPIAIFDVERHANEEQLLLSEKLKASVPYALTCNVARNSAASFESVLTSGSASSVSGGV